MHPWRLWHYFAGSTQIWEEMKTDHPGKNHWFHESNVNFSHSLNLPRHRLPYARIFKQQELDRVQISDELKSGLNLPWTRGFYCGLTKVGRVMGFRIDVTTGIEVCSLHQVLFFNTRYLKCQFFTVYVLHMCAQYILCVFRSPFLHLKAGYLY